MFLHDGPRPEWGILEEFQDGLAVGRALGFDGPPQQQRHARVAGILVVQGKRGDDGQGVGSRETPGGAGELRADFDIGFAGGELLQCGGGL